MVDRKDPDKTPPKPRNPKIREQALAVLRETRAKIDPKLLQVMKERLSSLVPPGSLTPAAPPQSPPALKPSPDMPSARDAAQDMPLSLKPARPVKSMSSAETTSLYQKTAALPQEGQDKNGAAKSVPSSSAKAQDSDQSEPVDRQKVAKIVMEYMKQRQEKSTTH